VGHEERICFLRFHPLASDVMATGSYDGTIRVWNIKTGEEKYRLEGHTDSVSRDEWTCHARICSPPPDLSNIWNFVNLSGIATTVPLQNLIQPLP
jgi:WD40 repeat protein